MWSIETLGTRKKIHFVFICWANTPNYNKEMRTSSFVSGTRAKFLISDGTLCFSSATCIDETVEAVTMKHCHFVALAAFAEPFALISRVVSSPQLSDCLTSSKRIEIFREDNFLAPPGAYSHDALSTSKEFFVTLVRKNNYSKEVSGNVDDKARLSFLIKIFEKSMYLVSTLLKRPRTIRTWNIKTGLREGWNASDSRVSNYSFREISEDW